MSEACPRKWPSMPFTLLGRTCAYLIMVRRMLSIQRPDTLTQTFFTHALFHCIQTADHTFSRRWEKQPKSTEFLRQLSVPLIPNTQCAQCRCSSLPESGYSHPSL